MLAASLILELAPAHVSWRECPSLRRQIQGSVDSSQTQTQRSSSKRHQCGEVPCDKSHPCSARYVSDAQGERRSRTAKSPNLPESSAGRARPDSKASLRVHTHFAAQTVNAIRLRTLRFGCIRTSARSGCEASPESASETFLRGYRNSKPQLRPRSALIALGRGSG